MSRNTVRIPLRRTAPTNPARIGGPASKGTSNLLYVSVGLDRDLVEAIDDIRKATKEDRTVIIRHFMRKGMGMPTVEMGTPLNRESRVKAYLMEKSGRGQE